MAELNNLAVYLQDHSNLLLEVYGHTDESGNYDYNLDLSIRRAKSVVSYLINYGIDQSRLKFQGFGESKPLSESGGAEAFLNRRVEFQLINGKSN